MRFQTFLGAYTNLGSNNNNNNNTISYVYDYVGISLVDGLFIYEAQEIKKKLVSCQNKTNTLCVSAAAALLPIINNATKTSITPSRYAAAADHSAPRSFARALAISLGRQVTKPV